VIPCPACGLRDERGVLRAGLSRVRSKGALPGERLYRCRDCGVLWRCDESASSKMTRALAMIETTAEPVHQELSARRAPLLSEGGRP
jgi:uncharacterized Zn finger protein